MFKRLICLLFLLQVASKKGICQPPSNTGCNDTFFHKKIISTSSERYYDALSTTSNELFSVGSSQSLFSSITNIRGRLCKFNSSGDILWSKNYFSDFENNNCWTSFYEIAYSRDGNLLVQGVVAVPLSAIAPVLIKMTPDGIPVWTKTFPATYQNINFTELPDGSLIYTVNSYYGTAVKDVIGKLDINGNQVWCKQINTSRSEAGYLAHPDPQLISIGNDVFLSTNVPHSFDRSSSYIFKINSFDGSIIWEKKISGVDFSITIDPLTSINDLLFYNYSYQEVPFNPNKKKGRIIIDSSGSIRNITNFNITPATSNLIFSFSRRDPFIASTYFNTSNKIGLLYVDVNGILKWGYDYNIPLAQLHIAAISKNVNGGWFLYSNYGVNNNSYSGMLLSKVSAEGKMPGCSVDPNTLITTSPLTLPVSSNNHTFSDYSILISNQQIKYANQLLTKEDICMSTAECNSLSLKQMSSICNLADTLRFVAVRNSECTIPVKWTYDTSFISYSNFTDSSADFLLKRNGLFELKASLKEGCSISEKKQIDISLAPGPVNFGPDTVICQNNKFLLNAKRGYKTYLWQDNSTDSTFLVTQPGFYHVIATDYCGTIFKDSINVAAAPPVTFDAGPDRTKCNNDTLHLSALSGFLNYTWSNNYNINSLTSQNVVVNPLVDTAYYIKAEKTAGCFVYDTVHIKVYHSPIINLGNDINLCPGDSIVLNAGTGFESYLWNSGGGINQLYTVYKAGVYSVTGIASSGCRSYDTIIVHPKVCISGFFIPSAFTPNSDQKNDLFKPLIFQPVKAYKFVIYNRWGQIVFQSTDPDKGWDGTFKGIKQDGNVFVWICLYQFEGEVRQYKKGTVVLIR